MTKLSRSRSGRSGAGSPGRQRSTAALVQNAGRATWSSACAPPRSGRGLLRAPRLAGRELGQRERSRKLLCQHDSAGSGEPLSSHVPGLHPGSAPRAPQHDFHETLGQLEPVERLLLTTDGTLSDLLASLFLEDLVIRKLEDTRPELAFEKHFLGLEDGDEVCQREVLLKGASSRRNHAYAKSAIVLNRLPAAIRRDLEGTNTGIGRLWLRERTEIFKHFIVRAVQLAPRLRRWFDLDRRAQVLTRSYVAYSRQLPVAVITEQMPRLPASLQVS